MITETLKIEAYVQKNYGGRICAAYGCSLGGGFVGLLVQRGYVHIDHGQVKKCCGIEESAKSAASIMKA